MLTSGRRRSLYLGLLEFMWALAGGVGPIIGGAFSEYVTWRWNYWVNLPISGSTFVLLLLFLDVHNPRTKILEGVKAIDWFGSLSILGLTLMLLLGLNFGGETFPWNSPKVICLIIFGCAMSLLFIYSEKRLAKYPLMPMRIFNQTSNVASLLVCFTQGFVSTHYPFDDSQMKLMSAQRSLLPESTTCRSTSSPSKKHRPCVRVCSFFRSY